MSAQPITLAVLTVSDGVAAGTRDDVSGRTIVAWADARGMRVSSYETVADDAAAISARLIALADARVDVLITTGGTGLTLRDVTPEATASVIERPVPGIPEALRARGAQQTEMSWLSRGVAGVRGRTLIINLPGSTNAVRDGLAFLEQVIDHAVQLLRGIDTKSHPHG